MSSFSKEQFVTVLNDAGITDEQKRGLHVAFEKRYPQAHQSFLEWLSLSADEIRQVRAGSRA